MGDLRLHRGQRRSGRGMSQILPSFQELHAGHDGLRLQLVFDHALVAVRVRDEDHLGLVEVT